MPRVSTFLAAAEKAAGCLALSRWSSPRRPVGKNDLDKPRWRLEWEKQGRLGKHTKKPPSGGFFPCGAGLERPPLPGKEEEQTKKQKNKTLRDAWPQASDRPRRRNKPSGLCGRAKPARSPPAGLAEGESGGKRSFSHSCGLIASRLSGFRGSLCVGPQEKRGLIPQFFPYPYFLFLVDQFSQSG